MDSTQLIHPRTLLTREDNVTLAALTSKGLNVISRGGQRIALVFTVRRAPFEARPGSGWQAVTVLSPFGEESTLLYEGHEGGRVSGIVRLVRPVSKLQRAKVAKEEI